MGTSETQRTLTKSFAVQKLQEFKGILINEGNKTVWMVWIKPPCLNEKNGR